MPLSGLLIWIERRNPPALPTDAVHVADAWADENSCIDCHDQAASFGKTGHAQTLRRASSPKSVELLQLVGQHGPLQAESTAVDFVGDQPHVIHGAGTNAKQLELDWCFGSGHHACTWTSILPDSSGATDQLEFRWTWYQGDVVDVTPGQPAAPAPGYFGELGVLFDGPKAFRCFACHSSYLPTQGEAIDEEHLKPGVTCQRCHGPRQAHVASEGQTINAEWQPKDQMDAVNRCAQCHRRADEIAAEVSPNDISIVRFQPVGLVQSACFLNSEMTCTTCHDPHLPFELQDTRGIWQCVQCHDPGQPDDILCSHGELDACLGCHMPAVRMDAPVSFTDHWIRIRDSIEPRP